MYCVVDTHSFLWYLTDSPKLSKKAREIFDLCDQGKVSIIISAIVLLECMDILDKKKLKLKFEEIVFKINQADNFVFSEVNWSLILEMNQLKGVKDLHDRAIVATAKFFNASLVSKDRVIKSYYKRTVW